MKLWIDACHPAPPGYWWCKSVNDAKRFIMDPVIQYSYKGIELIDTNYDAGEYYEYGGDYIELLNWLEETGRNYPIRIHSQNPVRVENMRRIIQRNGWKEIK